MEIENWMKQYCGAVRAAFGDRVRYIGLQGSRGREKPDRTATSTWCAFWTAALCKTWRPTGQP